MNPALNLPAPLVAAADTIPNFDAIGLSPGTGWLLLACALSLAVFFSAHHEKWRRLLLRLEDPRPMAVFRILFGIVTLGNVLELWEMFEYLFTDEGVFPAEIARHIRARTQFMGYGDGLVDGDPKGFFGLAGFVQWAKGPNYSLLLFWDSPGFFWVHLWAYVVAMVLLIIGFKTRWVKWIALFLFHSIILRNLIFWEGTENVFRTMFFYLCLSRCDRAYSVDNWLRCRKLRKQGRLSERGGPGDGAGAPVSDEHPKGLRPIYEKIPTWPRILVILQYGALYLVTGVMKNGPVWHRGDAFYYALNLDHFYRIPPQQLSAVFGTTIFRLNTWITHYWECFFPMVILGLILRYAHHGSFPPMQRWRKRLSQVSLGLAAATFIAVVEYTYPVHYRASPVANRIFGKLLGVEVSGDDKLAVANLDLNMQVMHIVQWLILFGSVGLCVFLVWFWRRLRDRPFKIRNLTIDVDFVCRWVLGRRVWLFLGFAFHGHLIVLMNIGWFSPVMLAGYVCFLNGREVAGLLDALVRTARELKIPVPKAWTRGPAPVASDALPDGYRDGIRMPTPAIWTAIAMAAFGVWRHAMTVPDMWPKMSSHLAKAKKIKSPLPDEFLAQDPTAHFGWFLLLIGLFVVTIMVRRSRGFMPKNWVYPGVLGLLAVASALHEADVLALRWAAIPLIALCWVGTSAPADPDADNRRELPRVNDEGSPESAFAYGPVGRMLVTALLVFHVSAVALWLLPDKWCLSTFRSEAKNVVAVWLKTTQTTQGWGMFAPNPPRRNVFMRVVVTDQNGETYDLNTDVYACFQDDVDPAVCDAVHPIPWVWYSRRGKINRRVVGSEGGKGTWYQKWHARWLCRDWAKTRGDGMHPQKVELIKVTYPIPSPEAVRRDGAYDPEEEFHAKGNQKVVHTTRCNVEQEGQVRPAIRERHGLPELPEGKAYHPFKKKKCKAWEAELRKRAKKRGIEASEDDPEYWVCTDHETEDGGSKGKSQDNG